MDPISHAALGASCAQVMLGKYNKNIPWQMGALAAMAPDLDIFIRFKNDPMSTEFWHRHFTHSLLFIPLGALIVALFFLYFTRYRRDWKITIAAVLIGYATHGFLDALTAYGTLLYWPISDFRVSWDIMAIVDPIFTIPLILGTLWSVMHEEQKGALIGLLCAALMVFFNTMQHYRALQVVKEVVVQQKIQLTNIRVMPELASSVNWRSIAKNNNCLLINQIHTPLLQKSRVIPIRKVPLFSSLKGLNLSQNQQKNLAIFDWFSNYSLVIAEYDPLILVDARYTVGQDPLYALWGIKLDPQQEQINKLSYIKIKESCP